jgi:hypothetical protein
MSERKGVNPALAGGEGWCHERPLIGAGPSNCSARAFTEGAKKPAKNFEAPPYGRHECRRARPRGATIAANTMARGAPQIFVDLGGMTILVRGQRTGIEASGEGTSPHATETPRFRHPGTDGLQTLCGREPDSNRWSLAERPAF